MQELKVKNIQKSLEVLADFQNAVQIDDVHDVLREKKVQAQYALRHLTTILNGDVANGATPCRAQPK